MRALLAIGCNSYDGANSLEGAEADARSIFHALVESGAGWYDSSRSKLLLSPLLSEVTAALRELLFDSGALETFTLYFAGHGGVTCGSFYMWVRDTEGKAQSVSALPLADVFRYINEASPKQTNLIIDACESNGLIDDLSVLLKPELLGDAGSPALTLIATSARNQGAQESAFGGVGTNAILDCIEGREFVSDAHSALDLVEIGRKVSVMLQLSGQNPVVWGLNLYGAPGFCKNPHHDRDGMAPLRDMVNNWPAEADTVMRQKQETLWAVYTSIPGDWDQIKYQAVVRSTVLFSGLGPEQAADVCERLAATFLQRCMYSSDPFRPVLVVGILASSLLSFLSSPVAEAAAKRLIAATGDALRQANAWLLADLAEDRFALLADKGSGFPDLYFLPLRVAKVLGWAAAGLSLCQNDAHREEAEHQFRSLLKFILENYPGSVVALSDAQAPAWCIALAKAANLGMKEEGEQLLGLIFHSLVNCSGHLARWDLSSSKALEYLIARSKNDFSGCAGSIERPIETLTVLLKAAGLFDLEQTLDEALWRIDGTSFSAYVPSDLCQFNAETMSGGHNFVWSIGHDVCRISEFIATWPSSIASPASDAAQALVLISALTLPDRQPWFLLEGKCT